MKKKDEYDRLQQLVSSNPQTKFHPKQEHTKKLIRIYRRLGYEDASKSDYKGSADLEHTPFWVVCGSLVKKDSVMAEVNQAALFAWWEEVEEDHLRDFQGRCLGCGPGYAEETQPRPPVIHLSSGSQEPSKPNLVLIREDVWETAVECMRKVLPKAKTVWGKGGGFNWNGRAM